jgi:hypothetical protein
MSDRLISADKAKEVLKHLLYETAMDNDLDIADIYEDIIENRLDTWIELIPTVDAELVRHGHWIWMGEQGDSRYMCSVCKSKEDVPTCNGEPTIWEYCPNCGAKMDEVEEDAETD